LQVPAVHRLLLISSWTRLCVCKLCSKISELCHNIKEFINTLHVTSLSCSHFVRKFTQRIQTNNILCIEVCIYNEAIVLVFSELCVTTHVMQVGMNAIPQFRTDKESTRLVTVAKLHSYQSGPEIIIPRGCYLCL
jgi:hypothetical protein